MNDWVPVSTFRQRGPVVLRMRVQPVTLGHLELLDELGVDLSGNWTVPEFVLLCFVLAQDHQRSRRDVGRWWFPVFCWFLGRMNRKRDITKDVEEVIDWISFCCDGPKPMIDFSRKRGEAASPLHVSLISSCLSRLHLSMRETLNLPVRKAKQLVLSSAEMAGDLQLTPESHYRFLAMCDAAEKARN